MISAIFGENPFLKSIEIFIRGKTKSIIVRTIILFVSLKILFVFPISGVVLRRRDVWVDELNLQGRKSVWSAMVPQNRKIFTSPSF
jgi:hypothetical protein